VIWALKGLSLTATAPHPRRHPGPDPGIHPMSRRDGWIEWMAGSRPAMTT